MTLTHHSGIPYAIAAAKAAEWARQRYQAQIDSGRKNAAALIQNLIDNQPKDHFVWHRDLDFRPVPSRNDCLEVADKSKDVFPPLSLHRNALSQACVKSDIPAAYVTSMLENGQADLAAQNLNRRFQDVPVTKKGRPRRYNLRAVQTQVRGFVSDSFPLWDSNALVEAFIAASNQYGGIVVGAQYSDLQFSIEVVLPQMFEPIENEVMLVGMALRTSDFGISRFDISALVDRLWCTNLARMQSEFSKRHLGRQYDDGTVYSQETMNHETETLVSATKDVVKAYLDPANVTMQLERINTIGREVVNADHVLAELRKKSKLTKEEEAKAKELYRSADTQMLPRGDTRWRLSNALSLLAQQTDTDRRLDLEEVAGEVAGLKAAA